MRVVKKMQYMSLMCFIIGFIIGIVIFFYKYGSEYIVEYSLKMFEFVKDNLVYLLLFIPFIFIISYFIYILIKICKTSSGGGIPVSEGIVKGVIKFSWLKTFIVTIISSYLSFFMGLSLGVEGPSVLIGTSIGEGVSNCRKKLPKRYLLTSAASAAFASATCAPISGILFSLEEIHKKFSKSLLLVTLSGVCGSVLSSLLLYKLFNINFSLFGLYNTLVLPLNKYGHLFLFSIIIGIFAYLFSKINDMFSYLYNNILSKINIYFKILISLIISSVIILLMSYSFGGGGNTIKNILNDNYSLKILFILLLIKILLIPLVSKSGVCGGLFIPTLLLGALIGAIYAKIFNLNDYLILFIMLGMSSFMSSVVSCPLSGMVFSIEALGLYNNICALIIVIFISYIVSKNLNVKPMYDLILEEKIKNIYKIRKYKIINLDMVVKSNSYSCNLETRELLLPSNCKIISIKRKDKDYSKMDNDGDKVLYNGDHVEIRVLTYDFNSTIEELEVMFGIQDDLRYEILRES